jgi:hypothetical protein
LLEKVEQGPEGFSARSLQFGIPRYDHARVVAGSTQQFAVNGKIREPEAGEAGLPFAQQFAGASQAEVFLGNDEAVFRIANALQARTRGFAQR